MNNSFKPLDNDYDKRVRRSFRKQSALKTVGATIDRVAPGEVEISFPFDRSLTQQHGFIHAGILSTVLDSACGYAAYSLMPADCAVLTVEFKINLLSPAKGELFVAVGRVTKSGRTISVADGEMHAITGETRKRVATMTGTLMALPKRDGKEN